MEECFYLSAPLLILGLCGRSWRLAAYPLMLLGIGLGLVVLYIPFQERIYGLFGLMRFMFNWTFFGRCLGLLLGITLALLIARRQALSESPRWGWATVTGLLWMLACFVHSLFLKKGTSC